VRQGECRNTTGVREQGMRLAGNTGTWESQLSPCVKTGNEVCRVKETWRWAEATSPRSEPSETGHTKYKEGVSKVWQREVTNGALREGRREVLAEHSTESLRPESRLGRWGTEAQGTHCREGEAGQNRNWRERWARP
jgi:hypothetical protein